MICRRCGSEIPDNSLRCTNCGMRVSMYCPECKTLNTFGDKCCKNCGFELLIACPVCGSMNVYSAPQCRKCHSPLEHAVKTEEVKEKKQEIKDYEVVEAFSSLQSSYVNNDSAVEIDKILKNEDNTVSDVPAAEKQMVIANYDVPDIEKIFNVDIPDEQQEKGDIECQENEEETEETAGVETENKTEEERKGSEGIEKSADMLAEEKQRQEEETAPPAPVNNETSAIEDSRQAEELISAAIEEADFEELKEFFDEDVNESLNGTNDNNGNPDVSGGKGADDEAVDELKIEIQREAVLKAVNLIQNSLKKHIIAINGDEGTGKSAVLNQVNQYFAKKSFITLYGSCTPLVQITSFGFFQDAFLRMLGFPPYAKSTESFIKDFKRSNFAKAFSFLDGSELTLFLNIFYPSQKDNFDNILENKKRMFSILEKVLKSFLVNNNIIISIDNFELLDGASYDFIVHLLQKGFFNNRLKLIAAYQEKKSIQSYFDLTVQQEQMFETIAIKKFTKEELISAVSKTTFLELNSFFDKDYMEEIVQKSDGNAIRMEQEIALLFDMGYISLKDNEILINEENKPVVPPVSFEELIKLRINTLTPSAKNVLFMAAIMGYRFATSILCLAVTMPAAKAEKMLDYLIQDLFIQQVDKYTCEFKSLTLWKLIYQEAKADLLYKENAERLYVSLKALILSSSLQKLISCTEALSKNEAFLIWQNTASITAKLGDTNLYVIAQKQCLKILEEQDIADSELIKAQIYEEIGKLLCEKSPKEAVTYLSNVLDAEIKDENMRKITDISGYFIKSCYLSGNYFGVTEAVDAVIKALDSSKVNVSDLDIELIKTRKLKALLNIGNSEQIVNLAVEDILPVLERGMNSKQGETRYKNLVTNAWLLTKITLAKAYAEQGNDQVSKIVEDLRRFLEKNNNLPEFGYYKTQTDIIDAFAKTITGEINKSNEILNNIACEYKNSAMETHLLAEWNLVHIINRVLSAQNSDLKADLFELAAFTNNINEHFIKNIIKLILGYILKKEGSTIKALEIFNEEITYFAKEKVAIGALLSWALIVQISMETGDDDKALSTASKSLEIAQSPKINNYFFIIYFQKFLAEIYLKKGDLTAAKMYLEKSIMVAKQFELKYQLVELYISYGKYIEEVMKSKHIYSSENIKNALDMYNKALTAAKELHLQNMIETASRERAAFKTFCQLNSIEI